MHTLTYIAPVHKHACLLCVCELSVNLFTILPFSVSPPSLNCTVIQLSKSSWMRVHVCAGVCRLHVWQAGMFIVTLFEWPNQDNGLCCKMNELRQQQTQQNDNQQLHNVRTNEVKNTLTPTPTPTPIQIRNIYRQICRVFGSIGAGTNAS